MFLTDPPNLDFCLRAVPVTPRVYDHSRTEGALIKAACLVHSDPSFPIARLPLLLKPSMNLGPSLLDATPPSIASIALIETDEYMVLVDGHAGRIFLPLRHVHKGDISFTQILMDCREEAL